MNNAVRTILSVLAVATFFAGCGESYQGTYVGDAVVPMACGASSSKDYRIEVKTNVSGDDVQILITSLISKKTNQEDTYLNQFVYGTPVNAKFFNGNENFEASLQEYENSPDQVAVRGNLSSGRDTITGFSFDRVKYFSNNQSCVFQVQASSLKLKE